MTFLLTWLAFAATQLAATMSPGPAFVMTIRNAVTYGRRAGIYTAIGLGFGVAAHVGFVMIGLATLMAKSVLLYTVIKYAGAGYLIYLGIKGLRAQRRNPKEQHPDGAYLESPMLSAAEAIRTGFLTNLLNPKALVFSTAVIPQFIHPDTPSVVLLLFWLSSTAIEMLWFSFVSMVLNHRAIKQRFLGISHWIDRVCGGLMVGLGIKLAVSTL